MNNEKVRSNFAGTATAILLSFLLFYFPSVLAIYGHDDEPGIWTIFSIVMATLYTLIFCVNYFWIVLHPQCSDCDGSVRIGAVMV